MKNHEENTPNPKEIEKDISDFLNNKYGGRVKMVSPMVLPREASQESQKKAPPLKQKLDFDLTPDDLIAYLDQYIIKQDNAKAVLATKVCTHFNRIQRQDANPETIEELVGGIKNNVIMIGPTGVGKTYMIKLIAHRLGVPFVKGDATKFSETGYVGGDVEDLVRDLVREADDDIELAQYGIIYIDEIDKIAGSRNIIGADVSRTGVQRALLKPMEETEVDLKVPHDPISMFQEIERFRKTGNRDKRAVNTKNILFIVSGAFSDLGEIIAKRVSKQTIGFGTELRQAQDPGELLAQVHSEDLIAYGFESEFVGRLPVRTIFERLDQKDLFDILKNPNNPIILGKKLDFAAYGIDVKFEDSVLKIMAERACAENTGARGLVSAVEGALLEFERRLPSTKLREFAVTEKVLSDPQTFIQTAQQSPQDERFKTRFKALAGMEKRFIRDYLIKNNKNLADKFNLTLTPSRIDIVASFYTRNIMDLGNIIKRVKQYYDEVKKLELSYYQKHDINIVLEDGAIDFIIEMTSDSAVTLNDFERQLDTDFELGFKLIREKTGKNRFFITRKALLDPESFLDELVKVELKSIPESD